MKPEEDGWQSPQSLFSSDEEVQLTNGSVWSQNGEGLQVSLCNSSQHNWKHVSLQNHKNRKTFRVIGQFILKGAASIHHQSSIPPSTDGPDAAEKRGPGSGSDPDGLKAETQEFKWT